MKKVIFIFYLLIIVAVFLYSFTQIDLSLTFSRILFLRNLVKSFQYIGYFNRPLSTYLYASILGALFLFYGIFLFLAKKNRLEPKFFWQLLFITTILLTFSYNAFSYDIFNYMFDARIITHYHQNPYFHKALDYPGDPMLSFMHWTQRMYPYGPFWLILTVPLSFLGLQFFLPTFFLFKVLASASFLGSVYYIGKISRKIPLSPSSHLRPHPDPLLKGEGKYPGVFHQIFFAFNPLVLIESVVSAHLDIVMIFFCLWAFYLLLEKRYVVSWFWFLFSVGIKFATGFLAPVFLFITAVQLKKRRVAWQPVLLAAVICLILTVVVASVRTTFQAWYWLLPLSFAAFLSERYFIVFPSFIITLFAMFTYIPFLYTGNWNPPIPLILSWIYIISYILAGAGTVSLFFSKRISRK